MTQRPRAAYYTTYEGGPLLKWNEDCLDAGDIHSVLFEDGWIWDSRTGWRLPLAKETLK